MKSTQAPNSYPVITIDGPSGTGKGTIARYVAKRLHWRLLESGILYRILAYAAIKHHILPSNEAAIVALVPNLDIQFDYSAGPVAIIFEGQDVSLDVQNEAIGNAASIIAAIPAVRDALILLQRSFLKHPGLVTDGRDMGTVIFPEATLKIYLDASIEERGSRRYAQLREKGLNVKLSEVCNELALRDERDRGRDVAPLKPAHDAVIIDTTALTLEQVKQAVFSEVSKVL